MAKLVIKKATKGYIMALDLPWMQEAKKVLGLHETSNKQELSKWLSSDGYALGDPEELPWCADYVDTAINLALKTEPRADILKNNRYWARNWLYFGKECKPSYGAILVFSRPGGGGHVGFAVGEDSTCYHVLGGNQSNKVSVTRIEKSRLLGARWPSSSRSKPGKLPLLTEKGVVITTNES